MRSPFVDEVRGAVLGGPPADRRACAACTSRPGRSARRRRRASWRARGPRRAARAASGRSARRAGAAAAELAASRCSRRARSRPSPTAPSGGWWSAGCGPARWRPRPCAGARRLRPPPARGTLTPGRGAPERGARPHTLAAPLRRSPRRRRELGHPDRPPRDEAAAAGAARRVQRDVEPPARARGARPAASSSPPTSSSRFGFEDGPTPRRSSSPTARLRVRGRIDRVDVEGDRRALVRDYKVGEGRPATRTRGGERISSRSALYLLAVRGWPRARPVGGVYQPLRARGRSRARGLLATRPSSAPLLEGGVLCADDVEDDFDAVLEAAAELALALAARCAPASCARPETCMRRPGGCAYPGICRSVAHDRRSRPSSGRVGSSAATRDGRCCVAATPGAARPR